MSVPWVAGKVGWNRPAVMVDGKAKFQCNGKPDWEAVDRIVAAVNGTITIPVKALQEGVVADMVKALENVLDADGDLDAIDFAAIREVLVKAGVTL